jgi:hypothetical protein
MHTLLVLIFSVFFSLTTSAKDLSIQEFNVVEKKERVPKYKNKSVEKLAAAITKDSCSDYDNAKRIYVWIAANIKYDVKRYDKFKWKATTPQQTLRRRKTLCMGYSLLFQALCKEAGIKAWVVEGYDKIPNYRNSQPYYFEEHAWNVFQSDTSYHIVDVTWGSGRVSRSMKIIVLFKHPFCFQKGKFVRDYKEKYFDSDTSLILYTHLPLLPMWQLKSNALSVERFEKHNFLPDSNSKNQISYKQDIQTYDARSKEDAWVYEGNKGYEFFNRNNRTKGLHTYKYVHYYYEKYDLENKKSNDVTRKKVANTHADTVAFYLRKFSRDNVLRHKYVVDSIKNRDNVIRPFSAKLYRDDLKAKYSIKSQIRGLNAQIVAQDNSISRRHKGFSRTAGDDIETIRKSYSKKHVDTLAKIIATLKFRYNLNTKKIDSLNACRAFWDDSVHIKMPELDDIHLSMAGIYRNRRNYIAQNLMLNRGLMPLYLIRSRQDSILATGKSLRILQNEYAAVQRYIYTNYFSKQIDPLNRVSIQLLKQNKSLIKSIAKLSTYNDVEKKQYRLENKKLYQQLAQTTKRSEVKIQILEKNISWLKQYKKILKSEIKILNSELMWQFALHQKTMSREKSRNAYYNQLARNAVNNSVKMKQHMR